MYKLAITLLLASSLHLVVPQLSPSAALPSQQGLARLLFSSRIMAQNPLLSMTCFTDYIAYSNSAGRTYSQDYSDCMVEAKAERKKIDSETEVERREIMEAAEGVCGSLRTCNEHNNTLELFNCHTKIGTENTKSTYSISGNASQYATVLQENYRLIDLHHQQCCHNAERRYVTDTADNYNHLQNCLDGRAKPRAPPTTLAPTSSTATTTSSTATAKTTEAPPPPPPPQSTTLTPPIVVEELTTTDQNQAQV